VPLNKLPHISCNEQLRIFWNLFVEYWKTVHILYQNDCKEYGLFSCSLDMLIFEKQ